MDRPVSSQRCELDLPSAQPVAVGAATVGADQQLLGAGVGVLADLVEPTADGLHGEPRGVVVGADRNPAVVGCDVVNAVGVGLAQLRVGEVVHVHPDRVPGRSPLTPTVLVEADEFLLLGIHADHRLAGSNMFRALLGELAELGVAVFVGGPLDLFLVALQRETLPVEQIRDRPRGHPVPGLAQLPGKSPGGFHRPPQR